MTVTPFGLFLESEARPFPELFLLTTDESPLALPLILTDSRSLLRNASEASVSTLSPVFPGFNKDYKVIRDDFFPPFEVPGLPQSVDIALGETKSKDVSGIRVLGKVPDPDADESLEAAKRTKRGERLAPCNPSLASSFLRAKMISQATV